MKNLRSHGLNYLQDICVALLFLFYSEVYADTLNFAPYVDYPSGGNPYSVVLGDVNGDSKLDVVTANVNHAYDSTVSVLLGNGNGTFQNHMDYPTGDFPNAVVLGDLNGDGKPDLVTANYFPDTVSVLLGNGDGTFKAKVDYFTGPNCSSVAIGDVNGDGKPDLVAVNWLTDTASVLLGNGDGTFKSQVGFSTGLGPRSVALGDVDGDGKLDIATANQAAETVSVLLGNGNGTFKTKIDYPNNNNFSIALADMNGDSKLDLVTGNNDSTGVSVLLGNGDGTFKAHVNYNTDTYVISIVVGDVNGDGNQDVVATNVGSGGDGKTVSVLLGNGDGTLKPKADFTTGSDPMSVALGDVNGDGKLDLAVSDPSKLSVSILLNRTGLVPETTTFIGLNNSLLTISLTSGINAGDNADWWFVAFTPWGHWYSYIYPNRWIDIGTNLSRISPAYQGQLVDVSNMVLFNIKGIPRGAYVFYFGVDTNMNGILDYNELYYSSLPFAAP